ncbi:hypothetical protein [Amycolatopsis sp. WGS_07]|uniref:hypothetical protein n=1 Tax=Amycolatopsis sp. WGS_07 TaxID=3076764 RepID=UPI00387387EB
MFLRKAFAALDKDANPVLATTAWDQGETAVSTLDDVRRAFAEAGRHGWVVPSTRPGMWRLTTEPTAAHARAAATAVDRREVILADDGAWRSTAGGDPIAVLPPTPVLQLRDLRAVTRFVLGAHYRDADVARLVPAVLAGDERNGVTPEQARQRLAQIAPDVYRRTAAAALGAGVHHGRKFNSDGATIGLQRLLDGDPTLRLPAAPEPTPATAPAATAPPRAEQPRPSVAPAPAPEPAPQATPETALETEPDPLDRLFPALDPAETGSATGLRAWLRETMQSLPREIDGVSTGPVRLALALAGTALASGDAFTAEALAARVAGSAAEPGDAAQRVRRLAGRIADAAPRQDAFGLFGEDRSLPDHLHAVADGIDAVLADEHRLRRAQADALFATVNPDAVRVAAHFAERGDLERVHEFLGGPLPPHQRTDLIDPGALWLLQEAFVHQSARTRFDTANAAGRLLDDDRGEETALSAQALAQAARDRARAGDEAARALRHIGIATIAYHLDEVAAVLAREHGFALPGEPGEQPQETATSPLVPADVASALRALARLEHGQFAHLVREVDRDDPSAPADATGSSLFGYERGPGEKDPGAVDTVQFHSRGMDITVDLDHGQLRTGRLSWPQVQAWVRAGLNPARHAIVVHADTALRGFDRAQDAFDQAGEGDLARTARQELAALREQAGIAVVDAAQPAQETGRARIRRPKGTNPKTERDLVSPDALAAMTRADRETAQRILDLSAVLPGPDSAAPAGSLRPLMPRAAEGLGPRESGADGPDAGGPQPDAEPAGVPVPDDVDPADAGWERTATSYGPEPTETWTRGGTQLVLAWRADGDALALRPRVVMRDRLLPGDLAHEVSSAQELRTLLDEAGRFGMARLDGPRWAVFPQPTAAACTAMRRRGSSAEVVRLDPDRGWVRVGDGVPLADLRAAQAPRPAPGRPTPPHVPGPDRTRTPPEPPADTAQDSLFDLPDQSAPDAPPAPDAAPPDAASPAPPRHSAAALPGGLLAADLVAALGALTDPAVVGILAAVDEGATTSPLPLPLGWGFVRAGETGRADNRPDALEITAGADGHRTGRVAWRQILEWVRAATVPETRQLMRAAVAVNPFVHADMDRSFAAAGEETLAGIAQRRVWDLLKGAQATLWTRLAAVIAGEPVDLSGDVVPGMPAAEALDWVAAVAAVLVGPRADAPPTPADRLVPGDVIVHPVHRDNPFRITATPVTEDGAVVLTGEIVRFRGDPGVTRNTVTVPDRDGERERCQVWPLPASLASLVQPPPPLAPPADAPDTLAVPADAHPSSFGWALTGTSYEADAVVQSWTRHTTTLLLRWVPGEPGPQLSTRLVLLAAPHPDPVEHVVASLDDVRTVLAEAGFTGTARQADDGSWVVSPVATRAIAANLADRDERAWQVGWERVRGWGFEGRAVPVPETRIVAPSPAAPDSGEPPRAEGQSSLWDSAAAGTDAVPSPVLATGLIDALDHRAAAEPPHPARAATVPPGGAAEGSDAELFAHGISVATRALADAGAAGGADPAVWSELLDLTGAEPAPDGAPARGGARTARWWVQEALAVLREEFGCVADGPAAVLPDGPRVAVAPGRILMDPDEPLPAQAALLLAEIARLRWDAERAAAASAPGRVLPPVETAADDIDRVVDSWLPEETRRSRFRAASPRERDELRALGRQAAALGYRLGAADGPGSPGLPFSDENLTYNDLIEEARRRVEGARIATAESLAGHPAVEHVRVALARRWLPEDGRLRAWTQTVLAMEAVADYVPTPQGLSLPALGEYLFDASTPGHDLGPRWLDLLAPDRRHAVAGAIDQAARVLDAAAEAELPWLAAKLRAVGRELRWPRESPADDPPRPGLGAAGLVLLPAQHPAAAQLETQLRDALRFQPWIHGTAEHAGHGVTALLSLLESPPVDPETAAASIVSLLPARGRTEEVVAGLAEQLTDVAYVLAATGHTRPAGYRAVPLPDFVREVSAQLRAAALARTGRSGSGVEGIPRHRWTMMVPVARIVQRAERRRQLEEACAARVPHTLSDARADADTALQRLDEARADGLLAPVAEALDDGEDATARARLAAVLTTVFRSPRALGGQAALGILRLELQRAALGPRAPEPDWIARSVPTTGLHPGGASDLAANCTAWAEAIRNRSEAGDDLGRLLLRTGIRAIADALDEQAGLLAARHATAAPRTGPASPARAEAAAPRRDGQLPPPALAEPDPAAVSSPQPHGPRLVPEPGGAGVSAPAGEPGLFDLAPARSAEPASAADQPWALAPAGTAPVFPADAADDPGPYAETFAQVLAVAKTAVVETLIRGGHDPDSWLGFSDLVMRHPDGTGRRTGRDGTLHDEGSLWWLRHAARVLRDDHGIELEVRPPARGSRHRPDSIALDRDSRRLVLDGGQPAGTLAFNAMVTLAELQIEAERDAELHRTSAPRHPVEVTDEEIDSWLGLAQPPADPDEAGVFTAPDLYARAHALAREAAALGMRLGAPAGAPPVLAREFADPPPRRDQPEGVAFALPLSARGLPQRLEEARTRIDGLTIATTADLNGHPAVARIRESVADVTPGGKTTPEQTARLRGMAAAMALQDFLPLPQGLDLVSVVEETALLRGTPEELLPRRLDHVPGLVLPHVADVLRQAGRCLDTADESLGWLAARMRAMAGVLEQRAAQDHGGLPVLPHSRTGLAALTVLPPDHPASPSLETQLNRYRSLPVASLSLADSYAMNDILATLADPAGTPEQQADRLAVDDPAQPKRHVMTDERRFDLGRAMVQIAHTVRAAGHLRPVGDPALPLPDYLDEVGHALMRRSGLASAAPPTAAPTGDWSEDTVARRLRRRAENAAAERKRAVKDARITGMRARQEATAILHAMTAPEGAVAQRAELAMAASEAGDPVSARMHLADAIAAADRARSLSTGADAAQGLVVHWLQRDVLGERAMTPAWVARASTTTGRTRDSAETTARHLTANLAAWAWALRAASQDADRLGRMLQAVGIDRVAADLDAVSSALAERHAFRAPETPRPAPPRQVGPVVLGDGRELARVADEGQLPHRFRDRWPGDAFMLTVPGRARVIVAAPSPEVADAAPWWWAVQQLDDSGETVGAELVSGTAYRNPAAAVRQAEKAFGQLLAALEKPVDAAAAGVDGPMADLAFVPKWGGFAEQLNRQNLPASLRRRTAQLALGMIPRLDAHWTTPESNASWLLAGGDGPR